MPRRLDPECRGMVQTTKIVHGNFTMHSFDAQCSAKHVLQGPCRRQNFFGERDLGHEYSNPASKVRRALQSIFVFFSLGLHHVSSRWIAGVQVVMVRKMRRHLALRRTHRSSMHAGTQLFRTREVATLCVQGLSPHVASLII